MQLFIDIFAVIGVIAVLAVSLAAKDILLAERHWSRDRTPTRERQAAMARMFHGTVDDLLGPTIDEDDRT